LWRSGCLRAGPKQIFLRRLFRRALEEQHDDSPFREGPEDPIFRTRSRACAHDDDGGATGGE
jgi:hypothetical protein